jgi:hypothetical protein
MCKPDIKTYYDLNEDLVRRDQRIYNLAASQPAGSKIFAGGRVVIIQRRGEGIHINLSLH